MMFVLVLMFGARFRSWFRCILFAFQHRTCARHAIRMCDESTSEGSGRCDHYDATVGRATDSIGLWGKGLCGWLAFVSALEIVRNCICNVEMRVVVNDICK